MFFGPLISMESTVTKMLRHFRIVGPDNGYLGELSTMLRSDHVKKFDKRMSQSAKNAQAVKKDAKTARDWVTDAATTLKMVATMAKQMEDVRKQALVKDDQYGRIVAQLIGVEDQMDDIGKPESKEDKKKMKNLEAQHKKFDKLASSKLKEIHGDVEKLKEAWNKIADDSGIDAAF